MSMRQQAALLAVVLAMAAGYSRSEEVEVCAADDPTNCKPASAWEKEAQAEFAKQRRYAESLPFDYRDLVHALLLDYLHSSSLPGAEQRYFVSVFGSDIDTSLTARMHESGFDILPVSAWTPPEDRNKNSRHISRIKIDVSDIEQVADDTYTVAIGYYCGPRCAGSSTYKLHKDGNGWRVIDRQMRWIARAIGDVYDAAQPS
jgi:hypothetical protein